ncbi:PilN domain-containing protein [Citrifermentans bremense]|uniref:PilN domain-containing protein n=1 Tax=Citrifermentans bremense TaxID=60035 RepID=UPI00040397AA|nr:PilN domain-containing protein [Citrifermentans bremense]
MKLTINLATRRYLNMRRLNAALFGAGLLLAALLVYQVREIANNQVEFNTVKRDSAAANSARPGAAPVSPEQLKSLESSVAFANEIIDKKTLNWLALLDKLEGVVPAGVALTQVEPVLKDQALKLTGVAYSFSNLRTLLENMEQSPNFSEVYLLSQSELKVDKSQQGIGFAISCKVGYR